MAGRALGELAGAGHLSAKVVGDSAMAEAHERFSGVGGTTDVLTFDLRASEREALCVDVLVCLDQAERAARARGLAVRSELLLYLVHAMLHCLGHDDHDEAASAAMHAAEDRLLTGLGVGPVYGVNEGGRGA
jgi:probable rRNA maturation factor